MYLGGPDETISLPSAVRINGTTTLTEGAKSRDAASPVDVTI
jgi:hypothetical protein